MKSHAIERMHPATRRRFLKWLSAGLAGSALTAEVRHAILEVAGGKAYAEADASSKPTYLIEICLRDQWDNAHVMVPPGMVSSLDTMTKGPTDNAVAVYLRQSDLSFSAPHRAYLTPDSLELKPHLDHVAMIDSCNHTQGATHGHESANPIRSPGRTYSSGGGSPMWRLDLVANPNFLGCEQYYASTPTPAALHNHIERTRTKDLKSGVAFKGISRVGFTAYHYGAGLDGAELDRVRSKKQLFELFPTKPDELNVVSTAEQAVAFDEALARVDRRYLEANRYSEGAVTNHVGNIHRTKESLFVRKPRVVSLPLSDEEKAYWGNDVPPQQCTANDTTIFECAGGDLKAQIWEQAAYAHKLLASGLTRTFVIEFDFRDLHNYRPESSLRTMGRQISKTLARLIQKLKDTDSPDYAGKLFERTLIAVYTVDGSRAAIANSYGDTTNAKNSLILAGGMIKGGYYGDYRPSGVGFLPAAIDPQSGATLGANTRVSDAAAWKTVMRALDIPVSVQNQFSAVKSANPLTALLRDG